MRDAVGVLGQLAGVGEHRDLVGRDAALAQVAPDDGRPRVL